MKTAPMSYRFKVYYLVRDSEVLRRFAERFDALITVNYESVITTDEEGAALLRESARRGFILIRSEECFI